MAYAVVNEYNAAKLELTLLMKDENKGKFRHNWLKLSDTFHDIYLNNVNWTNRPAALFRSAKAIEEMAYRSYVKKDAMLAIARYENLIAKFSNNPLADDSHYQIASIYSELLQNNVKAEEHLSIIQKKYPKSDSAVKAKDYLAKINGNAVASLAPTPIVRENKSKIDLSKISANNNGGVVKIVLATEKVASWRARYFLLDEKYPAIIVTLNGTKPSSNISLNHEFEKNGILSSYQINYNPVIGQTVVTLKFSDLLRFAVKSEREPAKLIIEATNNVSKLKNAITVKKVAIKPTKPTKKALSKQEKAYLNQFLQVKGKGEIKTIVIDPGHGGHDPGAIYNGITEKVINLDISNRLAKVLRRAGYTVHLTRTTDKFIELDERPKIANKHKADLFISVHVNANRKSYVNGFETYVLPLIDRKLIQTKLMEKHGIDYQNLNNKEKSALDKFLTNYVQKSKKMALMVQQNSLKKVKSTGFKVSNGGIREEHFKVLIGPYMPSILVEVGYSSNLAEAKKLRSSKYKDSLADGIANGLHQYASSSVQAKK